MIAYKQNGAVLMEQTESTELEKTMKEELAQAETNKTVINEKSEITENNETDIFAWANNLVQYVDELKIDLYFFNKNYTVYKAKLSGDVHRQLRPLFLDKIMEYILDGIENGLSVRAFEDAEKEDGILQYTSTTNVEKLATVLNWIRNEQHNIEQFDEAEHDFKRIKGVAVHCTHPEMPKSFTIIKNLPTTQIMKGHTAWMLKDDTLRPFDTMSAIKIPDDNQLLVIGLDVFVFNQSRLKQLFGYDAKAAVIAAQKVAEIESHYKLSFAEGANLQALIKGKPSAIKKLQKIQPGLLKQQELIDHAEELGIDLMSDDTGSIIIMNDKDLVTFVNLLNDDYMESNLTGQRYEILSKRPLKISQSDDAL